MISRTSIAAFLALSAAAAAAPPVPPDSYSPYDAAGPFAPPFPTQGLTSHVPGANPCGDVPFCIAKDGAAFYGDNSAPFPIAVDPSPGGRGAVIAFGPAQQFASLEMARHVRALEVDAAGYLHESAVAKASTGFAVAFWVRTPPEHGKVAGINPLFMMLPGYGNQNLHSALAVVLHHGVPTVTGPFGEAFAQLAELAKLPDDSVQRVDDGEWHHIAFVGELLCTIDPRFAVATQVCRGVLPDSLALSLRLYVDGARRHDVVVPMQLPLQSEDLGGTRWLSPPVFGQLDFDLGSNGAPSPLGGQVNKVGNYALRTWAHLDDVFFYRRSLSDEEVNQLRDRVEVGLEWLATTETLTRPILPESSGIYFDAQSIDSPQSVAFGTPADAGVHLQSAFTARSDEWTTGDLSGRFATLFTGDAVSPTAFSTVVGWFRSAGPDSWLGLESNDGGSIATLDLRMGAHASTVGLDSGVGPAYRCIVDGADGGYGLSGAAPHTPAEWRLLSVTSRSGIHELGEQGYPMTTPDGAPIPRQVCHPTGNVGAPWQKVRVSEASASGALAIGWVAGFDRALPSDELLAWSNPGPSSWFRVKKDAFGASSHERLSGRAGVTWYRGGAHTGFDDVCAQGKLGSPCTAAAYESYLTGAADEEAPAVFTSDAEGYQLAIPSGVAVLTRGTELGLSAGDGGQPAPFAASLRFKLNANNTYDVGTRTLYRRLGWDSTTSSVKADVEVRLRCNKSRCFRLEMRLPSADADPLYFTADVDLAFNAGHVVSVSWTPGNSFTYYEDSVYGGAPFSITSVEPFVAVDGVLLNTRVRADDGYFLPPRVRGLSATGIPDEPYPGISVHDPFYVQGPLPTSYFLWAFGVAPHDSTGSPLGLTIYEGRAYARLIEELDVVGTRCTQDLCGDMVCYGLTTFDDANQVGSPHCLDCKPNAYATSFDPRGRASSCEPKRAFLEPCGAAVQCLSGICLPTGTCGATPGSFGPLATSAGSPEEACAVYGRTYSETTQTCDACLASYEPTLDTKTLAGTDPRLRCAPVVVGPGEKRRARESCASDAECKSGRCLDVGRYDYGYQVSVPTPNHNSTTLNDSTDCGKINSFDCKASATYAWESLGAITASSVATQVRACAAATEEECSLEGNVATKVPGAGTTPATYRCADDVGSCAENHTRAWHVLSPQACQTLYEKAFVFTGPQDASQAQAQFDVCTSKSCNALKGGKKFWGNIPKWVYASWKTNFLTAGLGATPASQKVLTDVLWQALTGEGAKEAYGPADYSRLETLGVGPLLISYITNETERTQLEQHYGQFLPLASCGSLTEYRNPADNTVLVTYPLVANRAYYRSNVNRFTCAPNRQDNDAKCPPDGEKPGAGHVWCKSRFCSKATKTCQDGGNNYGSTSGRTGDDHDKGSDGVSFGIVRNDDTTLEVYPNCPRTAATCGNGIDDDNDGYKDDDDADCWSVREKQEDGTFRIVRESLAVAGLCTDGVDNDGDGKADAADRDCDAARAAFAGEQPPCKNQENDAEWRYVADMTQSHKLFMFGVVIPGVPLFETNVHIDHSKGAACGSSSLRAKVIGVTINVPRKPLVQCTGIAMELTADCKDAGGDVNLQPTSGCEVNPVEFFGSLARDVALAAINPVLGLLEGTAKACIPFGEDFEKKTSVTKTFADKGIPLSVKVGLTLDLCIEAFMGLNADDNGNGLPRAEIKPVAAVGVEARGGVGIADDKLPFEVWAGAKIAVTIVSLSFPIGFNPSLELSCYNKNITDGPAAINCNVPDGFPSGGKVVKKGLLLDIVLTLRIDFVIDILSGSFSLFFEVSFGPLGFEKNWELFAWTGFQFMWNLLEKELTRWHLDFEFDPALSIDLGQ